MDPRVIKVQLPITLRQLFYRLVATGVLDKTEVAYNNLGVTIDRARRGRLISCLASTQPAPQVA